MGFVQDTLAVPRPDAVRDVALPRRQPGFPSPVDWRDEIIYFLLPDRFSDGQEQGPPLDPARRAEHRPAGFRWDNWSASGAGRFQGGTVAGVTRHLDYIAALGATTIWLGPIWKQRAFSNDYHGYAIQDFLEVDPRFGTRADLVDLIEQAHQRGLRVLLDVIFNHTAPNWNYADGSYQPPYRAWPGFYQRGQWRTASGGFAPSVGGPDDGVWPRELQVEDYYTRAGEGDLGRGDIDDPYAEYRRTDFVGDRDINYDGTRALEDVARCYKYWIALTDCDGFRLDTLKHTTQETGRNFCGSIKEFAASLGKHNFFLVGEVAGNDGDADRYRQVLGSNLNATLDIGNARPLLTAVAKGLVEPRQYFDMMAAWDDGLGSHRDAGKRHVSILDDHDHVSGTKVRFSTDAASDHQVVAGVAIQLFSLGIPCIFYGTEQAFAGPEKSERERYLPDFGTGTDRYLREAMFGPTHPRGDGVLPRDQTLPGFGPFGTVGAHCFNASSPAYVRIAALAATRREHPALRYGRQYQRPVANFGAPFSLPGPGELIAWSRILDDEEVLCAVNGHGTEVRGGDVLVDADLNAQSAPGDPWAGGEPFFQVLANSAQAAHGAGYTGAHPIGSRVPVRTRPDGSAYVELRNIPASEAVALTNRA
jgi:glycosidase